MKTAAVVGWSGFGESADLVRTVSAKSRVSAESIVTAPGILIVGGADPVDVSRRLRNLPGVSWVAAGYEFSGEKAWLDILRVLARRYLKEGSSFALRASVTGGLREEGDILLDGVGAVLKSVKGSKVDERNPDVVLRVVTTGNGGAVGAELAEGPGGVPTSRKTKAACLVSGGYHSAVMAWLAVLSGYAVTLVHARTGDESLRQVGRLYAEISRRADPKGLELLVLDGAGDPGGRLRRWLESANGTVLSGSHPACRGRSVLNALSGGPEVAFPLLLMQEDEIRSKLESLGLKIKGADDSPSLKPSKARIGYTVKRFGGKESDVNGVLDSILG